MDDLDARLHNKHPPVLNCALPDSNRSRRRVVAARKSLGAKQKITWWFGNRQSSSSTACTDHLDPLATTPRRAGSPDIFLPTPETKKDDPTVKKKRRYRRRRTQENTASDPIPPLLPSSSQEILLNPDSGASPCLAKSLRSKQIRQKSRDQSQKEAKATSSIEKASRAADASFAEETGNRIPTEANMD